MEERKLINVYIRDIESRDFELIRLLIRNETSLTDFIQKQEEYIEMLEDELDNASFSLDEIAHVARRAKTKAQNTIRYKPSTLNEIKATHGSE